MIFAAEPFTDIRAADGGKPAKKPEGEEDFSNQGGFSESGEDTLSATLAKATLTPESIWGS